MRSASPAKRLPSLRGHERVEDQGGAAEVDEAGVADRAGPGKGERRPDTGRDGLEAEVLHGPSVPLHGYLVRVCSAAQPVPIGLAVDELRDRLEQALLRRAARLLDDMADRTGDELTEVMRELDERIAAADGIAAARRVDDGELRDQLAERDGEIARLRASIATLRRELDEARAEAQEQSRLRAVEAAAAHENERRARELQQRLAEATLRRTGGEVFDGHRARFAQRETRLAELETIADERQRELEELEQTVARREVHLDLREDELDRTEQDLKAREERLNRREAELQIYVGQVQDALLERR